MGLTEIGKWYAEASPPQAEVEITEKGGSSAQGLSLSDLTAIPPAQLKRLTSITIGVGRYYGGKGMVIAVSRFGPAVRVQVNGEDPVVLDGLMHHVGGVIAQASRRGGRVLNSWTRTWAPLVLLPSWYFAYLGMHSLLQSQGWVGNGPSWTIGDILLSGSFVACSVASFVAVGYTSTDLEFVMPGQQTRLQRSRRALLGFLGVILGGVILILIGKALQR